MDINHFRREVFHAHNNFRMLHSCPLLIMSEDLNNNAQTWAERLADKNILQYSENPNLGENILEVDLILNPSHKGEQMVKDWYKEMEDYNYKNPGWKKGCYHASQILWKSSTEIGIGFARIPGHSKAYMVVNYRPAGNNNIPGEFERNVLPPQPMKKLTAESTHHRMNENNRKALVQ